MNDLIRTESVARFEAAHKAYRIVQENGEATGAAIVRGYMDSFVRAHAALYGWGETLRVVREMTAGHYVPPIGEKLRLVHDAPPPVSKVQSVTA
jgi:hypothetical protein